MEKYDISQRLKEIIEAAEKTGSDTSLYYITTLNRYQTQIKMMEDLKTEIKRKGEIHGKLVAEYNKIASAANQTVITLIKIVQAMESIMDL